MTDRPTNVPTLSWAQVRARRLDRHALSTPRDAGPADIAATICGAHAQVLSAAELSIGLRTAGLTRADVRNALWSERSLVKAFGPRGTVHLLAAPDLPMWTGALSAVPASANGVLTPEQTDEVVAAIASAIEDAELTVDELSDAVIARTGPWAGDLVVPGFTGMWPRWRSALATAGVRGALCFGPNRGRKVTYTDPRRWLPGLSPAEGRSALAELVGRYLRAYGPATPQHFAQWLSAPRRWATELFDSLSDELERVDVDGSPAWLPAGDTAVPSEPPEGIRLLPYFDAYTVGSHPRELVFHGPAAERALSRGQAGNVPVLLVDGTVAGVWHQRRSGRRLDIRVEPFGRLTAARRRELDAQVQRIGHILEATPTLTIGAVDTGKHL